MAQGPGIDVTEPLRRRVDSRTFARGSAYARSGAVLSFEWTDNRSRIVGKVQGGRSSAYTTSATVIRSAGTLSIAVSTCSCPMSYDCKHMVALLLVGEGAVDDGGASGGRVTSASRLQAAREAAAAKKAASGSVAAAAVPAWEVGSTGAGRRMPAKRVPASPKAAPAGAASRLSTPGRAPGRAPAPSPAPWERLLKGVLMSEPAETEAEEPGLGLQFDVVVENSKRGGYDVYSGPRIKVLPLVPGRSDNWVRTGVSWSNLEYYHRYRGVAPAHVTAQVGLLKELLALSRTDSSRYYYSSSDDVVWLDSIKSRRLWDLLTEARDLRIPLLLAGRAGGPVTIHQVPAEVSVDATLSADGALRLRPGATVGDVSIPLSSSLFIGEPAHGLAWWSAPGDDASPPPPASLDLAPLSGAVEPTLGGLVRGGEIFVPSGDVERFVREFLPVLSGRMPIVSADGSVPVPDPEVRRLVLSIASLGGTRCGLEWSWVRGRGSAEHRSSLWHSAPRPDERADEDRVVDSVVEVVREVTGLVESTFFGPRLVPEAELWGMAAAEFVSATMVRLAELDRVEIEVIGELPDFREAANAPVVELGGARSTEDGDWFDLLVTVTVDGEEVPFHELFTALAEERSHLVLPSGTFFSLDGEELRRLAELIAEARTLRESGGDGVVRVGRFQAGWWEEVRKLGVLTTQAAAWETSVRALANVGDRVEHPVPAGMVADLRPYQVEGFNWLAFLYENRLGGILADDMGLGKTLQALALMCHVREHSLSSAPFLVVAPTSVVQNWGSETARFAPGLKTVTVSETTPRRGMKLADLVDGTDLVVTSYALFRLEFDEYEGVEWAGLLLDEAQFVKNLTSQGYRRARMLSAPFKLAMTGTPMENNLMELWSLLSITAPGLLSDPTGFSEYYRTPVERQGNAERLGQLRRRIRPLMLRRTKEQVAADLPEKLEQVLEMDLNPRHRKVYQTYLQRERQKVLGLLGDMSKNRFEIFRSLTLLRQASLDVGLIDEKHSRIPSTKLDALMEMVEEIAADGHRVLVFSQFTRFLTMARRRLEVAEVDHCYLDGRTRNRAKVIDRFRTGDAPVFLISLKAGGFGLNLTEADYCIVLDPWWNPATEAQAVDRAHRIGQTKKVMVYRLVAKDTIEEKVMAMKAKKSALFANVIDSGELGSGAAITAEDIRGLLG